MTDSKDVLPEDDIGPFYKTLGAVALLGWVVFILIGAHNNHNVGPMDIGVNVLLLLAILALIRPRFFDSAMKTIADKLPMFSFVKKKNDDE